MKLDPTRMDDWQIARAVEERMKSVPELAETLGVKAEEVIPVGRRLAKLDHRMILQRLDGAGRGKYVDVTAITPTPLGEGKTTTTLGLIQGLARIGRNATGAIRQPSGGPTFNIKGSAAGGGLAQCIPLTEFSMGLTGDIDAIGNAHNLAMVALTARLQHERNYDDARLAQRRLKRLDIDPARVDMKWVIDFCAQSLRQIRIGLGGKMDGIEMDSGFAITVSSELMAILAIATSLRDLRERIARMVVACDRQGREITTADLEVDGAMCAWMLQTLHPTLVQTLEGQPLLVHAGPFANIAIGQSSIMADLLGTRLADYHVTESGFGADIGFEKFWNIKCRLSGLTPDAVVIVATIRALKMHGGGPDVKPGLPLHAAYATENLDLLEQGCCNLAAHVQTVRKSGVRPVVCINRFQEDTEEEIRLVRRVAEEEGALCALSEHWLKGGAGACELAEAVVQACEEKGDFRFLYEMDLPIEQRIERIAHEVYEADGVSYSESARAKLDRGIERGETAELGVCMVKTHLSLSHDPARKGRPRGWTLPIGDLLVYRGAGLLAPMAGSIKLMPGTASDPNYRNIDVDVERGQVTGMS